MNLKIAIPAVLACFSLISCGGGGGGSDDDGLTYSGNTSEAEVDSTNADKLAIAATGGSSQAIASEAAQDNSPLRSSPIHAKILDHSSHMAKMLSSSNRTANQIIDPNPCTSGNIDVTSNSSGSSAEITYNNCVLDDITANGRVTYSQNSDGSFTFSYINFTVTYLGETHTLNMTAQCDSSYNCTYLTDYEGPDGRTYRVEGATVSSTGSTSYTVSATVYDPDHGYITINANVTYGSCTGGVPESGSITYTGSAGSSGSVVFNSCESFTVTVDGVGTEYFWDEIL